MATRYDVDRAQWSQRAHITARRVIYPHLFATSPCDIAYKCCDSPDAPQSLRMMDTDAGIDKIVYVRTPELRAPIRYTVQERFQRPKNAAQRNITITEWNQATDKPSELYKIAAMYFVGAFMTEEADMVTEGVVCPVPSLLSAILRGVIDWDLVKSNDKGQPFVRVKIDDLLSASLADLHIINDEIRFDRWADGKVLDEDSDTEDMPALLVVSDPAAYWREYDKRNGTDLSRFSGGKR